MYDVMIVGVVASAGFLLLCSPISRAQISRRRQRAGFRPFVPALPLAFVFFLVQPPQEIKAEAFPKRGPIRIVVPAPAGGPIDVIARLLANETSKSLRHPVIVENRPGGHFSIGANAVSQSPPDGHTLLLTSTSLAMTQALYRSRLYDLTKQFSPVTLIAGGPLLMAARRDLPVESVADVVKMAKAKPSEVKYGSGGMGSSMHLTAALFQKNFDVDMLHVPYQGSGPALNDLLGGHLDLMFDLVVTMLPQVTAGTVKPLAITSAARSPLLPNLPTVAESGAPGFEVAGWFALLAPAGTPAEITALLQGEVVKALAVDEVKTRLSALGVEAIGGTPASLGEYLRAEVERWSKVVSDAGVKAD